MWPAIATLGHLAAWAGAYVAAAVVCAAQLLETPAPSLMVLAFAWTTATAAYLLDRLKLRPAWIDPADRLAHPRRYEFLERHGGPARAIMAALWILSAVTGWLAHPVLIGATILAAAGVILYAGFPRRRVARTETSATRRVKDVFVLKNLFVGAGITGFSLLIVMIALAHAHEARGGLLARVARQWLPLSLVGSHLVLRIFADAVLCDIDDEPSDKAHATDTLPTRMGPDAAWRVAMWLRLGLAASLLLWPVGDSKVRVAWAAVTAMSTLALRAWQPRRIRDLVDARFALEAAIVWAILR